MLSEPAAYRGLAEMTERRVAYVMEETSGFRKINERKAQGVQTTPIRVRQVVNVEPFEDLESNQPPKEGHLERVDESRPDSSVVFQGKHLGLLLETAEWRGEDHAASVT